MPVAQAGRFFAVGPIGIDRAQGPTVIGSEPMGVHRHWLRAIAGSVFAHALFACGAVDAANTGEDAGDDEASDADDGHDSASSLAESGDGDGDDVGSSSDGDDTADTDGTHDSDESGDISDPPRPDRGPRAGVKLYTLPENIADFFEAVSSLGLDTVIADLDILHNEAFRTAAGEADIDLFPIIPVFLDPGALKADPSLCAVDTAGECAVDDWVKFVCPSREDYRADKVAEIVELVETLAPAGVSLDFIRHFVYWEEVDIEGDVADLPNTCFDDSCMQRFQDETGIDIPDELEEAPERAQWVLEHAQEPWVEWKTGLITAMVGEIAAALETIDPELAINVHLVPWRGADLDGAILNVAGQDAHALREFSDYVSPMTYTSMLGRDSSWIGSVVNDVQMHAHMRVLPSIQVDHGLDEDEELELELFEDELERALAKPSSGVLLWDWSALEVSPAKMEVTAFTIEDWRAHLPER